MRDLDVVAQTHHWTVLANVVRPLDEMRRILSEVTRAANSSTVFSMGLNG